jgi:hypothetical protein
MEKEYSRWKIFLLRLLEISPFSKSGEKSVIFRKNADEQGLKVINGIQNILLKETMKSSEGKELSYTSDRSVLKKLTRYFPYETSVYSLIADDIINSDYNRLSIWTKVTALRNMQEVKEGDPAQSVMALLFSPEQILREESWRLIERSGESPVQIIEKRIQNIAEKERNRLLSEKLSEKEMVFEKTRFLSSCFPAIPEEDLITLAEKIITLNVSDSKTSIPGTGCILWSLMHDKPDPEVKIITSGYCSDSEADLPGKLTVFCYALPLQSVEEYFVKYPERSYQIAEYIDCHED